MTKNNKKMPWCIEPFINISHTTDGYYTPCCIAMPDKRSNRSTEFMSPLEYMNSDYMKKIRRDMLDHNISKEISTTCRSCIFNEKNGIQSRRQNQNIKYQNENTFRTLEKILNNDSNELESEDLQYVNLKILGNICNLKCIMCNPSSSSKIAAEYKKHGLAEVDKSIKTAYADNSKEKYFNDVSVILESIDRFSLIGGEAFVHPDFDEIFDMLLTSKNVKNLELFVITNGTVLPQKVLDNAYKFRNVVLNFSIDGVGKRAEYIRNGTVWDVVDKNITRAIASDALVAFTIAIQALNIGYLDEIYNYISSLGVDPSLAGWNNLVTHPKIYNALNLPNKIKQGYTEKYLNFNYGNLPGLDNTMEIINKPQSSASEFEGFIKFTKQLDGIRNTNLLDVFPEFKEYYK